PRRRFDEAASRLERALAAGTETKRLRLGGLRLSPAILDRRLREARRHFSHAAARVSPATLSTRLEQSRQTLGHLTHRRDATLERRVSRLSQRLQQAGFRLRIEPIEEQLRDRRRRLEQAERLLKSVSYQ